MLQPTGPQEGAGPPEAAEPPPRRVAAGRDICRVTCADLQVGQATSASSDFRMMRVSKDVAQDGQAYS